MRGWLLAGFVVICLVKSAFALDPNRTISQYVLDKWGPDRGFVGGAIYAISQSSDGYLWIGTERGLVRFDGYNFKMIQQPLPDGTPTGPVRGLLSDAEGNLWIRLEGPRLLLYRNGKFEDVAARLDLQDITMTAMTLDNEGAVLLSGLGDRTLRYRNGRLETVVRTEDQPGIVISLAVTRDGRIWLGTQDNGLSRISQGHISKLAEESDDSKIKPCFPPSMAPYGSEPTTDSSIGMARASRWRNWQHRSDNFRFWPWPGITTETSGSERIMASSALLSLARFPSIN